MCGSSPIGRLLATRSPERHDRQLTSLRAVLWSCWLGSQVLIHDSPGLALQGATWGVEHPPHTPQTDLASARPPVNQQRTSEQ